MFQKWDWGNRRTAEDSIISEQRNNFPFGGVQLVDLPF